MTRPLDFIIFGVPRSGTKGLVRALNLHPQVYCAMERFHFSTDHSDLVFPDSFIDTRTIRDRNTIAKIKTIRKQLSKWGEIEHVGNKLPRYYFALDHINRECPRLKNIWIYRSPYGFMPSWNRREKQKRKGQWPAGQIGLFGLLELLVCIENCLNLPKDIFLFPYEQGLGQSDDIVRQALAFLGAKPSLYDGETFEATQRRKKSKRDRLEQDTSRRRLPLKDYEEELLDTLQMRDLDRIMLQGRGVMVSELAPALEDFLRRIAPVLPEALDRAFAACNNAALSSYGHEYCHRYRGELIGLCQLTAGSKALAGFQHFGIYEQLRSLYVQRWRLKRQLASVRLSRSG